MKIIDRYVVRQFLVFSLFILIALFACYVIVDFFGKIRMFLSNQATFSQISRYFYYMMPAILSQMIPASILLATLITFGNFARYNEIIAIKASGASIYRTGLPILITTIIITPFTFLLAEFVTPAARDQAERILTVEIKKEKLAGSFKHNQIWYRGEEGIYNFEMIDKRTLSLRGVTLYLVDGKFNLTTLIKADMANWVDDHWELSQAMLISFTENKGISINRLDRLKLDIPETPRDFLTAQKSPDLMGFMELYRYVKKLKADGHDVTPYIADLNGKIAFSLIGILMVPIGIAFGVRAERSGGIAQGITMGSVIGFSYWLIFAFCLSLGRAGTLPASIAPWLTDLFFLGLAIFLARRVST